MLSAMFDVIKRDLLTTHLRLYKIYLNQVLVIRNSIYFDKFLNLVEYDILNTFHSFRLTVKN